MYWIALKYKSFSVKFIVGWPVEKIFRRLKRFRIWVRRFIDDGFIWFGIDRSFKVKSRVIGMERLRSFRIIWECLIRVGFNKDRQWCKSVIKECWEMEIIWIIIMFESWKSLKRKKLGFAPSLDK